MSGVFVLNVGTRSAIVVIAGVAVRCNAFPPPG
jgi:hypothetical protein